MYDVFIRNWYKRVAGRVLPGPGRKQYIKRGVTEAEARSICEVYSRNHDPGPLSRKAEYTRA